MADYWKSNPRKFCDACKCWIADNKASVNFHENGRRHKEAMEKKIAEIRYKGTRDDKKAAKEAQWVQQMERAAMNDYMGKDLVGGADISARMFNEKKAERDAEKARIEAAAASARAAYEQGAGPSTSVGVGGPAVPSHVADPGPSSSSGPGGLRPVEAPKSGTKWHKEKKWFEAVTEEGHTYYWHVETHQSRWDAPPDGYFSVKEQEEVNKKHEHKELRKAETIYISQAIHGTHKEDSGLPTPTVEYSRPKKAKREKKVHGPCGPDGAPPADDEGDSQPQGPQPRVNPYGEWKAVEPAPEKRQTSAVWDFQAPRKEEPKKAAVTVHSERMHFVERKTPAMDNPSGGFKTEEGAAEPVTFKKRKLAGGHRKNFRRRDDDE